ncbi:MAG: hypothetical protein KF691_13885 [Phycisphaeraceae bacterium]|nr:hypothetical protein [Phycisphaeraceae bacterium]
MNRAIRKLLISAAVCAAPVFLSNALAAPQGTAFTYQGRLTDGGAPASGAYDIEVRLFDASVGGSQVGSTITLNDQVVSNGVFTAELDFGSQFDSNARWIELRVRPGVSVGAYTTISPRTPIDSAPYALGLRLPVSETGSASSGLLTFTNTSTSSTAHVLKLTSGAASGSFPVGFFNPVLSADTNNGNGIFALTSANSAYAIYAVQSGNGGRGIVGINSGTSGQVSTLNITNATNPSNALEVQTVGMGRAALLTNFNNAASTNVLEVNNAGTGRAGYFNSSNSAATLPTLYAKNIATGDSIPNASQDNGVAIKGESTGGFGIGVYGKGVTAGVFGYSGATGGAGVWGSTGGGGGSVSTGVRGDGNGAGTSGVAGFNNFGNAIYGQSSGGSGKAGFFSGDVQITGTLSKGGGSFQIDHPLDPANKFLYHSFVEAPNMMNMYDGIVKLNEQGEATVQLPGYFEALNVDYRYQLTCVGGSAPVYIAEEVSHNQFKIAGGKPGMKVSWLVTGTRNDPYAQYHRIVPEVEKKASDKGLYLHPKEYGQPVEKQLGIPASLHDEAVRQLKAAAGAN